MSKPRTRINDIKVFMAGNNGREKGSPGELSLILREFLVNEPTRHPSGFAIGLQYIGKAGIFAFSYNIHMYGRIRMVSGMSNTQDRRVKYIMNKRGRGLTTATQ